MDLISVIVPVYKVEEYLNKCIESIISQTYKNLEIILVDDGSPDNCGKICDEWAEKDLRIKVVHKENGGLSDARNAGMKVATGEYIAFVDSDDLLDSRMYEKLLEVIIQQKSDIAACSFQKFFIEQDLTGNNDNKIIPLNILSKKDALKKLITDSLPQVVWNKVYRRSLIENTPFETGKYHEDEFWTYQVIGAASEVAVIDYVGYFYRQRNESIMGERYSLKRLDAIEAKCLRQVYLEKNFPEMISIGKRNLVFSCIYQGQLVIKNSSVSEQKMAMHYLKRVVKKNRLHVGEESEMSLKHRLWFHMSGISFVLTCFLRNMLHIGL